MLSGGTGNDVFFVSGSDNGFDYYSGDPSGGNGFDIIRSDTTVNTTIGLNSLQDIDAIQGNTSRTTTIQLPVGGASIDFSRTQLNNISDISGNSGVDNIIGSLQSDTMFLYDGNDFYSDRNSAPSNSVDNIYAGGGDDAAIFGAGKSGNTLTANPNGTWTIQDTTLSVTYTVSHTAQTSWKVSSSTGSIANLYGVETVSFGDKQLTSTAPITPQSLSSGPATMEFATTSSETDSTTSDSTTVSAERDDVPDTALDANNWTASYTPVGNNFGTAYMAYNDSNANGASSLTTVSMLTPPTEVMTLTVA